MRAAPPEHRGHLDVGTDEWVDVRAIEANGVATPLVAPLRALRLQTVDRSGPLTEETAQLVGPGAPVPRERGVTVDEVLDAMPTRGPRGGAGVARRSGAAGCGPGGLLRMEEVAAPVAV